MYFFYTLLFCLLLPFFFLRLLWRSRRIPSYRKNWSERLGYVPHILKKSIWIHAVSVGESVAAIPLIKALQKTYPDTPVVVTNMTPTGAARVKAAFGNTVVQSFIPYDIPAFIHRLIRRLKPQVLIIMETELWPNLFAVCLKHQVPIMVANARLSEKSAKGYARIPSFNHKIFQAMQCLAAQTQADAERFIQLGLPRAKTMVTGNIKFDLEIPDNLFTESKKLRKEMGGNRLIWIAASTHAGEEAMMLQAHHNILAKFPHALLILVPRHPDRFAEVKALVAEQKFTYASRSSHKTIDPSVQVFVGDSMGELMLYYAVADVAVVGGSFVNVGGHNMLEPAVLRKAVLSGPVLYNFVEISGMLMKEEGMIIINNVAEIADQVVQLFTDENLRYRLGENAYQVVAANRGSLDKHMTIVKRILNDN